jgi:hypothetical protein
MNQIIHKQNTQNQNTFKSRLNGQPQLTIIQVAKAKSYNKRKSNYDFDRSMDGVSEELRPAAVANRAANLQTIPDTDQLAANYDEKLKQMEKAKEKKILEMGQNSEKELDRMSKQIQSGDEQNLN